MQNRISVIDALNETGLKKKYIADKLGVSPQWLPTYLSKPKDISIENATVICELTGKKMCELDFDVSNKNF